MNTEFTHKKYYVIAKFDEFTEALTRVLVSSGMA
jgi:hypothetical protein